MDWTAPWGRVIAGAGLPTVFVQEGGYNVEAAGEIVANLFKGMEEGMDVDVGGKGPFSR